MSTPVPSISLPLSGQVALITGGGSGIGLMIAKGFAESGAKVYITGRREQVLNDAAASVEDSSTPGVLIPMVMDVTNQQSIDTGVKVIEAAEGKLDILVNCAGTAGTANSEPDFFQRKFTNLAQGGNRLAHESFSGWSEMFTLNSAAPFFVTTSFQALLTKGAQRREATSAVINISSIVGETKSWVVGGSFAYGVTKSALDNITVVLATEYAQTKVPIRLNAIHPGTFPSELVPPNWLEPGFVLPGFIAPVPLDRPGKPSEMAQTAIYLATSQYTNGVILRLDGGTCLVNP